jgi:hypothetical protein
MSIFKIGESVIYEGKETEVESITEDNNYVIPNPEWDYYLEYECVIEDIYYGVPYWIVVKESELKQKQ